MNTPIAISVKDVRRSFRSVKKTSGVKGAFKLLVKPEYLHKDALKRVSFEIKQGAFIGLIGANGAGKTTLLKILSGLIPPTEGEARVLGHKPFERSMAFRKQIALVMGQKAQLWWDLPATDAFHLLQAIYEIPKAKFDERLNTLTELLDVKKLLQTQIRRLSLGERMKMELIGAILHWPRVIFLDEPTIGLDVLAAHNLREFLKVHNQKENATIILTSHNMEDIERLCSRVIILKEGDIVFDGAPDGLTREGERRLKITLMKPTQKSTVAAATGIDAKAVEAIDEDEGRSYAFHVEKEKIIGVLQALMNDHEIVDMGVEEPTLESVMQRLYEENKTL